MRWPEALRDRNFRLLYAGQAVSLLGDGMVGVALAFGVLEVSGSPSALGIVLAARMVPTVALLLAGGVIADRLPRRAVMVAADLVRLVSHGLMAALLISGSAQVWSLALLAAVNGAGTAFFAPASTALLPTLVPAGLLYEGGTTRPDGQAGILTSTSKPPCAELSSRSIRCSARSRPSACWAGRARGRRSSPAWASGR